MAAVEGTLKQIQIGMGEKQRLIDLSKLTPFTMGDRKRLLAELKLDLRVAIEFSPEEDSNLVLFILRKIDQNVTLDEVDALPTVVGQSIVQYSAAVSQAVDRPFSQSSTV